MASACNGSNMANRMMLLSLLTTLIQLSLLLQKREFQFLRLNMLSATLLLLKLKFSVVSITVQAEALQKSVLKKPVAISQIVTADITAHHITTVAIAKREDKIKVLN